MENYKLIKTYEDACLFLNKDKKNKYLKHHKPLFTNNNSSFIRIYNFLFKSTKKNKLINSKNRK